MPEAQSPPHPGTDLMGVESGGCRERGETGAGAAAAVATGQEGNREGWRQIIIKKKKQEVKKDKNNHHEVTGKWRLCEWSVAVGKVSTHKNIRVIIGR